MSMTPTQFAASALGLLPHEPPGERAPDQWCWLCGGETGGIGWPQSVAIAPTFTQHNLAKRPDSGAVCQPCASLTRAETFQAMVARRGLAIKTWTQCGWHSYSHHIREDGHYAAPTPEMARTLVLDPPGGRWLLCLNTSGKKHTIFRGAVATRPEQFPVQVDETTVWCARTELARCLADFEAMCALGFSKDSVLSGSYHPAQMLKAGLARWRPAEDRVAPWRADAPDLIALAHIVARGPAKFPEIEPATYVAAVVPPAKKQMDLFG